MSDGGAQHFSFGPFFDDDGALYRGIKVLITDPGTTNAKTYWTSDTKSGNNIDTGVLTDSDSDGIARAFFDGDYRFRVTQSDDSALDNAIDWDNVKITSDTATMWEGNFGTSFPSAAAKNRWHLFAKVTAGNSLAALGINTGSAFVNIAQAIGKGADVASTSELPVISDGDYFDVTGTTGITSIASLGIGTTIKLHFDDAVTITHDATDLFLPGGINITTIAGDELTFFEYASGDWRLIGWSRPDNLISPTIKTPTIDSGITLNGNAWPSFSVNLSGAQLDITGTDQIEFNTEQFDTNSDFDTTTFRFTPTVAGKYLFTTSIKMNNFVAGDSILLSIFKNGVSQRDVIYIVPASGLAARTISLNSIEDANGSSDYFEIFMSVTERNTMDLDGGDDTYWMGSRIA